jgi:hypothetical protein
LKTYTQPPRISSNNRKQDSTLFKSYIDSAIAYVNATGLYGSKVSDEETSILSHLTTYKPNTTYDSGVIAGYETIYNTTAKTIFNSPIGQIELLFMNSDANGDIGITAALQHPYSHGRIYINSSDPMDYPVIDPNYLANPAGTSHNYTLYRLIIQTRSSPILIPSNRP